MLGLGLELGLRLGLGLGLGLRFAGGLGECPALLDCLHGVDSVSKFQLLPILVVESHES
mgnify:CR=1 FL=1